MAEQLSCAQRIRFEQSSFSSFLWLNAARFPSLTVAGQLCNHTGADVRVVAEASNAATMKATFDVASAAAARF